MLDIFAFDWISFFIVGLATMFLVGELLVNTKGAFALLGFGLITLYFTAYLDTSMFLIMVGVYFLGILLIFVDGEFLNDGILAGIGALLMIVSVGLSSPNWRIGAYAIIGVVVGAACSLVWLKLLPKRNLWSKITLHDQLTDDEGYSSMNASYKGLIGERGVTLTDMRPIGTIRINKVDYSAISNGHWIKKDTNIIVRKVDGTRILVDPITESHDTKSS
ncbi:hypothetical protein SAMN04488134_101345 [Amphibacillus marinus]|uniref:NfeD-like C-terminal domain-containing protein n=1 Tax=Amphibacillus marinus TaxID=872970 RepID=A0A1H8HH66_9BACI|nr:NfeD family protein [Amphibacillus marinus]SEN55364.1 hypothetical protein SAMN04488134_101345 [Amphibacillus marinus]